VLEGLIPSPMSLPPFLLDFCLGCSHFHVNLATCFLSLSVHLPLSLSLSLSLSLYIYIYIYKYLSVYLSIYLCIINPSQQADFNKRRLASNFGQDAVLAEVFFAGFLNLSRQFPELYQNWARPLPSKCFPIYLFVLPFDTIDCGFQSAG
jgi:hypothetical protein